MPLVAVPPDIIEARLSGSRQAGAGGIRRRLTQVARVVLRAWPVGHAIGEGDVQEIAARLVSFETVGDHSQSEGLDVRDGFIPGRAVGEDPGQFDHLSDPTPIGLKFKLDAQYHRHTYTQVASLACEVLFCEP